MLISLANRTSTMSVSTYAQASRLQARASHTSPTPTPATTELSSSTSAQGHPGAILTMPLRYMQSGSLFPSFGAKQSILLPALVRQSHVSFMAQMARMGSRSLPMERPCTGRLLAPDIYIASRRQGCATIRRHRSCWRKRPLFRTV